MLDTILDTILHYLTLIFAVACFTVIYFKLLRSTVQCIQVHTTHGNNSDSGKAKIQAQVDTKIGTIYTSFMARLFLAFIFFYCLLKYYNKIRDIITICVVFTITRWIIIRHERTKFFHEQTKDNTDTPTSIHTSTIGKNAKNAGFSSKKHNTKVRHKSIPSTEKAKTIKRHKNSK